jgi:hypothetical protein
VAVSVSAKKPSFAESAMASNFESKANTRDEIKVSDISSGNELNGNNLLSTEAKVAENIENSEKINTSSFSKTEEIAVPDSTLADDFMQFLNPPTKGLINSSKAKLISSSGEKAVFVIPEKFKFLKIKLEAKNEELVQAIKQALNPEIKFIEIQIDSGMTGADSEVNDSVKVKPAMTSAVTPARVTEKVTDKEASLSVSEKAYSKPLADLENNLAIIAPASVNITNNPDVNLNINSVNSSAGKDSNDNCCDREAYLDEVLQAGVSIFGGNVVRE